MKGISKKIFLVVFGVVAIFFKVIFELANPKGKR